jgi:hypothetical protein
LYATLQCVKGMVQIYDANYCQLFRYYFYRHYRALEMRIYSRLISKINSKRYHQQPENHARGYAS